MAGFLISATFSSVFDLEPVFHPKRFDGFSFANILCLRLNFILFMLVFGFVFARFFDKKIFAASLLLSSMIFISAYAAFPKSAPKIRKLCGKTFIAAAETPMRRAAFGGDDSTLKSAVKILKKLDLMDGTFICANSFQNEESLPPLKDADSIILFGSISEFAGGKGAENCKFILISPPAHIRHAESGYEIYLPKRNAYSKGGFINCGKIKYF